MGRKGKSSRGRVPVGGTPRRLSHVIKLGSAVSINIGIDVPYGVVDGSPKCVLYYKDIFGPPWTQSRGGLWEVFGGSAGG